MLNKWFLVVDLELGLVGFWFGMLG